MLNIPIIGIGGNATSGKDSLYDCLNKILEKHKIETDRIALADPLKTEINDFTKNHYGISAFTKNPKEKDIIRPLMVVHGKIKRMMTNGRYFTEIASPRVESNYNDGILSICSDIRYMSYEEDEVSWLRKNNGVLIFVERINSDGSIVPPANNDETINNEKIKKCADFIFRWPTTQDLKVREDCVNIQLKPLIDRIIYK